MSTCNNSFGRWNSCSLEIKNTVIHINKWMNDFFILILGIITNELSNYNSKILKLIYLRFG